MTEPSPDQASLRALTIRFTDAFNRDDLDGVMAMMAEDAVYEEFTGTVSRGKAAIRAAFEPQFRGDFGKMRFETEDLFADAATGKALIRWVCRLETRLVKQKLTYAKAKVPLLGDHPRDHGEA